MEKKDCFGYRAISYKEIENMIEQANKNKEKIAIPFRPINKKHKNYKNWLERVMSHYEQEGTILKEKKGNYTSFSNFVNYKGEKREIFKYPPNNSKNIMSF